MPYIDGEYFGGGGGGSVDYNVAPIIGASKLAGAVTEQVSPGNALTDSGTIAFDDNPSDVHSVSASAIGTTLGTLTAVKTADSTGTGTGGVITWSYSVDDAKVEYLAKGQTKVESFTVSLSDGQGGVVTRQIDVTVTGTNDAPVISGGSFTSGITEAATPAGTLSGTGTIAFTDVDLSDSHTVSAASSGTTLGTLTAVKTADTTGTGAGGSVSWTYAVDAAKVEYLAKGQTKVEIFTITIGDGQDGSVAQTVAVTLTGTNDAPVIGSAKLSGAVTEQGSPGTALSDSGTIVFSDVDLMDRHSVSASAIGTPLGTLTATKTQDTTGSGTGGTVTWSYSVDNAKVTYLAAGQTKVESFTVTVDDGQGGTVSRQVDVTITGIGGQPASFSSSNGGSASQVLGNGVVISGTSSIVNDQSAATGGASTITVGTGGTITATGTDATDPYLGQGVFNGNQGTGETRISLGAGTSVSGSANGLVLVQSNTGNASAVSITAGGDVTGLGGAARLPNAYDNLLQARIPSTGNQPGHGVVAINAGTGTLTLDTSGGKIQAAQDRDGIVAINAGGLVSVTNADAIQHAASVTGGTGIDARNSGAGGVSLTNSGTISAAGGSFSNGVIAVSSNAQGAVSVGNQGILGGGAALTGTGITAIGAGAVTVSNAASITAGTGISASGSGAGTVTVNHTSGTILAGGDGIDVTSTGSGAIVVNQSVGQIGTSAAPVGRFGIYAVGSGGGAIGVTSGTIVSSQQGAVAINTASGDVTVATRGDITTGYIAVNAQVQGGSGNVVVTTAANTTFSANNSTDANANVVNAQHSTSGTGTVQVTNAATLTRPVGVTGGNAINATNGTSGLLNGVQTAVSVTNTGTITNNFATGINATTSGTGAIVVSNAAGITAGTGISASSNGAVTINHTAGLIQATSNGIAATSFGAGGVTVNQSGGEIRTTATGSGVAAINVEQRNNAGALTVTAGAFTSGAEGVRAINFASGDITVATTGNITGGLGAVNAQLIGGSGNVVVTTATKTTLTSNAGNGVLGASHGASGTGYVQIDNAATLTHTSGTGGTAIYASNGTSGSLNGVQTAVSVGNSGTITDKLSTGIDARGGSIGVVSVANSGSITVAGTGISLSGSGGGSVANSGTVGGANGLSVGGGSFALSNTGTIAGTTAAIQIASGTLTVKALGTINGAIVDNGQLTLNQAGSYTLASAVSGSGALTVQNVGAGNTATLSGALTQRGGFTVADASNVTVAKGASFYGVKLNGGIFTNLGSADTRAVTNGPSNNTDAIQTNGGGTVTNGAANATGATIQGGGSGLGALGSGATIVNNYGLVVGRDYAGVGQIGGNGAITINNLNGANPGTGGVIYGRGGADSGWGAFNSSGGALTVVNESAGKIVGGIYGVYGTGAATSVTNAGTIASGSYDVAAGAITVGGTAGIRLNAGGSVTNAGTVQGTTGLSVGGGTTTLSNTGTITGTGGNAIRIDASTLIIKDIGTINGAVVDNGQLVLNRAGNTTFANAVSGTGSLVVQGVGSGNTATLSGALTQRGGFTVADASAVTLTGSYVVAADGISLNGGTFTNQGIVRATGSAGTNAVTASTTVGATVVNAAGAQIVGQGSGVIQLVGNVPGALSVTNSGLIQGLNYDGVTQHGTGALRVANTGTGVIYGQNAIGSSNGYGVGSDGGGLLALTNAAGGRIVGQYGSVGSNAGDTITNAGTIASGSYDATSGAITAGGIAGVQLRAGGTVSNTGTISGNSAGIQAGGTATVVNSGAISAVTGRGVDLLAGGTLTNTVGGTISHTNRSGDTGLAGVYSSGDLKLTNAGTISTAATGASDGVTVLGVATVTNTGTIQAAAASGLALKGAGSSVVNSGTIQGGTISTGVTLISTGTIDNQAGGTIAGSFGGIRAGDTATIINAGTIQATSQQQGINLANGGTLINGGTANTGALVAAAFGSGVIAYGDAATSIDNYGRIQGTTFSGAGHESSGAGAFTLNNLGTGSVVYGTGNLGVFGLGSGALTVRNEGLIVSGGSAAIIANGAATVTNSGTIGTGSIDANGAFVAKTNGNAMTLNAGGTVVNKAGGSIIGGGDAIYAGGALVLTNAGRISSQGDTVFANAGGSVLNTGSVTSAAFSAIVGATGLSVTNAAGGTLTGGTNGDYGYAVQFARNDGTFDNYGTANGGAGGVLANQNLGGGAGVTLGLHAGSTTGAIKLITGNDTVSIDTGTGAAFAGVTGNGAVLQTAGTHAAAIVSKVDLGGGTNTINLRGSGDGTAANGAVGTLDMSGVSGATALNKMDGGTFVLTGAYNGSVAVDVQAGRLIERDTGAAFGSGSVAIRAGAVIELHDDVDVTHAPTVFSGAGTIEKTGTGTLTLSGASTYSGGTFLTAGTLELSGTTTGTFGAVTSAAAGTGAISFGSGAQTLRIAGSALGADAVYTFGNAITGFATDGDVIDVTGIGATTARFNYANSILNLIDGTGATKASLHLTGNYIGTVFTVASDGVSGTQVTLAVGNEAPRLDGIQATLAAGTEDTAFTVTTAQLLKGFVDPEGATLSVTNLSVDHGTIASDGQGGYSVTPAADYNGPLTISYGISDGKATTPAQLNLALAAVNDAPVVTGGTVSGAVTELVTQAGTLSSNGTFGFADVDVGDTHTASVRAAGTTLGSLTATVTADTTAGAGGSVAWAYTVDAAKLESLKEGETAVESFTVTVGDGQGGSVAQTVAVTLTGTNDAPVITSSAQGGAVKEDVTLTATGVVTSSDVDHDATATYTGNATGTYGSFTVDAQTGRWTYALDNAGHQELAEGEVHTETFTVLVTDDKGATASQNVFVTVTGTNDAPSIAAGASASLREKSGLTGASEPVVAFGSLTFADTDFADVHVTSSTLATATWSGGATLPTGLSDRLDEAFSTSLTDSTGSSAGSIGWAFGVTDKTVDFLAAGETLKVVFSVTVTDGAGASATRPVALTITGTNDAPVIGVAKLAGAVTEQVTPGAALTDSGTLAFGDVDLTDGHGVMASAIGTPLGTLTAMKTQDTTGAGTGGVVTWTYSVDDAKVESLAQGQTKVESFTVSIDDGHGGVIAKQIDVTITGTNDAPVITSSAQAGTVKEDGTLAATGQVTSNDVDQDATATYTGNATGTYGSFKVDAQTGRWTYALDNAGHQDLAAGETHTETFTVLVTDDKGATASQNVLVTV
ncbi:VCBS domain-containing protein, partial [Methylobacterium goesingense]